LTVTDLDRAIAYYEGRIGLTPHGDAGGVARFGAGADDLLVLTERPGASRARGTTGLYHFALLVPSRPALARALRRLIETRTEMTGMSDHLVSESLYLSDPDDNGIEIYRDRPRDQWPFVGGELRMATDPLNVDDLLMERGEVDAPNDRLPAGTRVGHIHLHVARIGDSERFYSGLLGFDLMQRFGRSASFLSAGGYHHHIGLNTWAGVGAPPPPPGAVGLRHFEVLLPNAASLTRVVTDLGAKGASIQVTRDGATIADPSGNHVMFRIAR
jgi:catechol 2,3-dioxygenase